MKIYDKKLAYPYFVWMVLFTVVPLFIVVYYALTDSTGSFTLDNLVTVSGYGSVFARSLLLALISTVICPSSRSRWAISSPGCASTSSTSC